MFLLAVIMKFHSFHPPCPHVTPSATPPNEPNVSDICFTGGSLCHPGETFNEYSPVNRHNYNPFYQMPCLLKVIILTISNFLCSTGH